MDDVEAAKLVTMLVTAYADDMRFIDAKQQAAQRDLFRSFLRDMPYDKGDAAVRRWTATQDRMPKISQLRRAIAMYIYGRPVTGTQAWGMLKGWRSPQPRSLFEQLDPVMYACVMAFGWVVWDRPFKDPQARWSIIRKHDHEMADRARFIDSYNELAARALDDLIAGDLAPRYVERAITTVDRRLVESREVLALQSGEEQPEEPDDD